MGGPFFIDKDNLSKDNNSYFEPVDLASYNFITPFTKVYYGSNDADNELLKFIDRANTKIDSVISSIGPSVIIEVDAIKQKRMEAASKRGVKFRYVTEITKDNIKYIKEMMQFAEIRHIEGLKGNFEVSDKKEYIAVATLKKAQPMPQLIFSNIAEVVEQQQFVFDSFWERAAPAEQIIKELDRGIVRPVITIFLDYYEAEKKEYDMIRNAKKEIQIIYSTSNAFYLQERGGILQLLKDMADKNKELRINILLPIDSSIKQSLSFSLLNENIKNNNIVLQDIAPSINIKIKSLVVDRKESLIMELKHVREEKQTASIGFSIYSNSESIVLSYASIFEVLYNQSILFGQMKEDENLKNEFINIAAHELRTPIMPILNGMEILEEKFGEKEKKKYKQEMDIIIRNATRLQNLAESILQVSRIESGMFSLSIQKGVDIHFLILHVIEDIEKKYLYTDKAKKVSIVFNPYYKEDIIKQEKEKKKWKKEDIFDGTVTDEIYNEYINNSDEIKSTYPQPPMYVDCDPQKISQVIFNLLDNAIKFTTRGLVVISTNFQRDINTKNNEYIPLDNNPNSIENKSNGIENLRGNKNSIIVTVEDSGPGIDEKIKDQLFEKFSSYSTQGTGLGLYLSKKIIESHRGKMWYEKPIDGELLTADSLYIGNSNDNNNNRKKQKVGSKFRFSLPVFY